MYTVKDLIEDKNVVNTYQEGKYLYFVLKNNMRVGLNINELEQEEEKDA